MSECVCPSYFYNMAFPLHSLILLVGEGFSLKIDRQFEGSHPTQMATLKMFPTAPLSSPPALLSSPFFFPFLLEI